MKTPTCHTSCEQLGYKTTPNVFNIIATPGIQPNCIGVGSRGSGGHWLLRLPYLNGTAICDSISIANGSGALVSAAACDPFGPPNLAHLPAPMNCAMAPLSLYLGLTHFHFYTSTIFLESV